MTVGNINAPFARNSGIIPTAPIARAPVSFHHRVVRRRATATIDCVRPKNVKPATMGIVPFHVKRGSSEIKRIHARAMTPSANPPNSPTASAGIPSGRAARCLLLVGEVASIMVSDSIWY